MGAHTPACLRAASDPVETVTPPLVPARKRRLLGTPTWRSEDVIRRKAGWSASRANWLVLQLYCIPDSGMAGDHSPPGIWAEIPCFQQVGDS